ncbi:hypothetical protein GQ53DRAFT_156156 [Thozetella sp. PMI_491]|nr:hypothetical protein GQ53DRAFT_156156 [Thozetella sp. PMI_491]
MSADLFAAFSDPAPSSGRGQAQQHTASNAPPSMTTGSDPFSFLAPSAPAQSQQQLFQQTSPWPASHPSHQPSQQPLQWPPLQTPEVAAPQPSTEIWGDLAGFGNARATKPASGKEEEEDDDGWGDFEVAAPQNDKAAPATKPPPTLSISAVRANSSAVAGAKPEPSPRTRIMRASTLDMMSNKLVDAGPSGILEPWQERPSWEVSGTVTRPGPPKPVNPDPNVLFDADDFNGMAPPDAIDDDDFGDFETVAAAPPVSASVLPPTKPLPSTSALDLISDLDFGVAPTKTRKEPPGQLLSTLSLQDSPYPQAPKSPSFQERNPFPGLGLTTPKASEFPQEVKASSPSPVTAWPSYDDEKKERNSFDENWGDFEARPSQPVSKTSLTKPQTMQAAWPVKKTTKADRPAPVNSSDWDWDAWEDTNSPKPEPSIKAVAPLRDHDIGGPPPTNVPPPSILLSLFPELLSLANSSLFKPLTSQPAAIKDRVLADATTLAFLRGYLALAAVAGRVIAGRKLRWHRDKFLSQGMTISAAGGKGGMKLSGIDKTQVRSEDREVADVVAVWKEHVGRLRSAVAAANSGAIAAGEPPLRIPELTETVAVQTAKGAVTAPKPCVVCGLKREERAPRVDFDIEDSFGEWWIEHWGHRTCRNFWLEHEVQLRQR